MLSGCISKASLIAPTKASRNLNCAPKDKDTSDTLRSAIPGEDDLAYETYLIGKWAYKKQQQKGLVTCIDRYENQKP